MTAGTKRGTRRRRQQGQRRGQVGACGGPQKVTLLCGLSVGCTCAGNTSTKYKAQKRLENKQPELDEVK
uniref:Uncharacterized protein n=1 Tax=Romanomermis culicivorax TaxID=13658 RepID=A0A915JVA3_ROMCU